MQCKKHSHDLILASDKDFHTFCHSKLKFLEKYIIPKPDLERVLPENEPHPLDDYQKRIVEHFYVLREVRSVARALEAERRASGSRAPRLLRELYDTICIFVAECRSCLDVIPSISKPRLSKAKDGRDFLQVSDLLRTNTLASCQLFFIISCLKKKFTCTIGLSYIHNFFSLCAASEENKKKMQ